jgi:hypothetical protein
MVGHLSVKIRLQARTYYLLIAEETPVCCRSGFIQRMTFFFFRFDSSMSNGDIYYTWGWSYFGFETTQVSNRCEVFCLIWLVSTMKLSLHVQWVMCSIEDWTLAHTRLMSILCKDLRIVVRKIRTCWRGSGCWWQKDEWQGTCSWLV